MATIEEILGKCSVEELRYAAEGNSVSRRGTKAELVSRLASGVPLKKALEGMSKDQIQEILAKYEKPRSGNKDELTRRVVALVRPARKQPAQQTGTKEEARPETKKVDHEKGAEFEKRVAAWARRRLKGRHVPTTKWFRGATVQIPHQVDVHIQIPKKWALGDTSDVWIECKAMEGSVKRQHIYKLLDSAKDAYRAHERGMENLYCNGLMFVSMSRFDTDALNVANEYDVLCVQYEEGKYQDKNSPKNWLGNPKWLQQARNEAHNE